MANDARAQITVERVTKLEERLDAIERTLEWIVGRLVNQPLVIYAPPAQPMTIPCAPVYPLPPTVSDCGCPPNGTCMNTACPRAPKVSSSTATDGVGWPD